MLESDDICNYAFLLSLL